MSNPGAEVSSFEVAVETRYIERESDMEAGRFVFAYTITIENKGGVAAQLMSRQWLITDGDGKEQQVQGPGVVGKQPRIAPGGSFRYTSAAVLETAVGTMQGHYDFVTDEGDAITVPIRVFSLAMPNAVH